jgi:hypothetical protein
MQRLKLDNIARPGIKPGRVSYAWIYNPPPWRKRPQRTTSDTRKAKPAYNGPVIFASCLCKAFRGSTRRFMLYRYVYPSKAQNAPQRPPQATRGTRRHTRPTGRRDQPGPATGRRDSMGQGTPGKWQRRRKGKRATRARKSPDPRKGEPG